ncbi:MAG TPA: PLP-dependent aminotransferase family protein, partial [Magnetospirillaceae bacterium]|nr:PLP-dependent aminotransferase family protein [Magnetospirillaceae bacterium]
RALRKLVKGTGNYEIPAGRQGSLALRKAIGTHIALTRAVLCQPDDIMVTAGAQQAFDLLARTLVTPGETVVAIEDPCYPPMRTAFAAAGAKIVPVPVDIEGMVVEAIPPEARIICVCPSHQFPLGVTLSKRRRLALEQLAEDRGAVIVEDDYDGEFRYGGASLQALHRPETAERVFYIGTFSKCMFPALRLGFVVAPGWARQTLALVKSSLDWHCPTTLQDALADFIAGGHLSRHIRKMRQIYDARRMLLLERLERDFARWLTPLPCDYGIHVAALAVGDQDLEALIPVMVERKVNLLNLARFQSGPGRDGLIFGFGTTDLQDIERGLDILLEVLAQKSTQRPPFSQSL